VTYSVFGKLTVDLEFTKLEDDGLGAVHEVLVDGGSVLEEFLFREPVLVDYLHLLDDRRLARLS
jgi:hypothetical protein